MIRRVWAVCTNCGAQYGYDDSLRTSDRLTGSDVPGGGPMSELPSHARPRRPYLASRRAAIPDSLQGSATAEALEAIVDVDLTPLADVEPPRGYGRD